jgi:hypothetical protein
MYQGGDYISDIFDATDISRLDVEMRVLQVSGVSAVTGTIQTTSDPTLDNSAWRDVGTVSSTLSPWTGTFPGAFSGLGRFVRGKITVNAGGCATACLTAAGRDK